MEVRGGTRLYRLYRSFVTRAGSLNIKRLLLIKENQISQVKGFRAFLYGKIQEPGLTEIFPFTGTSPISGQFPVFFTSWTPLGLTVVVFQWLSPVWLFVTPWTATHQAFLPFTISQSLLKLKSIGLVMPPKHLILCLPILLLLSIFPSFRVFSNESALHQVAKVLELQL